MNRERNKMFKKIIKNILSIPIIGICPAVSMENDENSFEDNYEAGLW